MNGTSAEGKDVACVLHLREVEILALLKGPGLSPGISSLN